MKTKIKLNHKKKESKNYSVKNGKNVKNGKSYKIGIVSKLKNKKKSNLKWKGNGGSKTPVNIKATEGQTLIGSFVSTNWRVEEEKIEGLYYIELTDSLIHVNFNGLYIVLNLDILSVDKLQYYINKGKLFKFSSDNNFLGLTENTILLKSLNKGGVGHYVTGSSNDFIDIYEDTTGEMISYKENLENLRNQDTRKFYINVKTIDHHDKTTVACEDVDWLNTIMESLNKLRLKFNINTKKQIANSSRVHNKSQSNLDYFLELYKENKITSETKIFNEEDNDGNIKCEDLNVDHTKLIIEDSDDKGKLLIDGEQYVIIGYPAEKMKSYLNLLKKNETDFKAIYDDHRQHFMHYMADLHNSMPDKTDKIDQKNIGEEIHKFYGYEDYYKYIANFYENSFTEGDKTSINGEYPTNEDYGIPYDPEFQSKFKELQKSFYNEISSKCLNKPMIKINYIFLIFKKDTEGKYKGNYVPALFNFRELTHKHHPILERLEKLIKTRLSKIYGIITDEKTDEYKLWYSHYNYGDIFHIKTEYVNTMSNIQQQAYKYKNSISLEELIYMLSIKDVNLINLRLDYQRKDTRFCKLHGEDLEEKKKKENALNIKKQFISKCKLDKKIDEKRNHTELLSNLLELRYLLHAETKVLLMFVETGNSYTFVYKSGEDNKFYSIKIKPNLCNIAIRLFKYLNDNHIFNKFYEDFKKKKIIDFIQPLNITQEVGLQLYEIIEHRPINIEDYKNIMRYNPLLVRIIKKQDTENNIIPITDLFKSPLVIHKLLKYNSIKIPNPYLQKPIIIRNIIASETYQREFKKFKLDYNKNKYYIYDENIIALNNLNDKLKNNHIKEEQYKIEYDKFINKSNATFTFQFIKGLNHNKEGIIIHCIEFNPDNCGYNLIELIEANKSVIWVVPLYSSDTEPIYDDDTEFYGTLPITEDLIPKFIGNFLKLNKSHIKLLNVINKKYFKNNKSCFINIGSMQPIALALHIHVINDEYYKGSFANLEQGSRLEKMLSTKTALNLLNLENTLSIKYYSNPKFNIEVLTHDKI